MTVLALLTALALPARAADGVADSRAAELAKLRRDVETLSSELTLDEGDVRERLKAVEAQRVEIEVQLRREELRLAQAHDEEEAKRAELSAHDAKASELGPALHDAIAALRQEVVSGLPFHVQERTAELDELADQLDRGLVTPETGVARLWSFTEDELRLAKENGLDRQVVPLAGGEVLADVARLGMVALYFRTEGGVVGCATHSGDRWTWTELTDRDEVAAVEALFEPLKHGIRTGSFVLPDPEATR